MSLYYYLNQDARVDPTFCFVLMPFDDGMKEVYQEAIVPAAQKFGLDCGRADKEFTSENIMLTILNNILRARLIIADITGVNANVLYELGICHAMKPEVIVVKHTSEKRLPFDVSQMRYVEYESKQDLLEKLSGAIGSLHITRDRAVARPHLTNALVKAKQQWKLGRHHSIPLEEFTEMIMSIDSLKPDDDGMAVLLYCAAHYGQKMRYLCRLCYENEAAIASLVREAASNTARRVPWRAAIMLEHCAQPIVEKYVMTFDDNVVNGEVFPGPILERRTRNVLAAVLDDPQCPESRRVLLEEVRRQVQAEFGWP